MKWSEYGGCADCQVQQSDPKEREQKDLRGHGAHLEVEEMLERIEAN